MAFAPSHANSIQFLISTQACHSPHVSVHPPIKNVVVGKLKNSRGSQSRLSDGAHKVFNVFVSQSRSKPSEKATKIIQPTDKGLPPLPGGGSPSSTIWQLASRTPVSTVTSTLSSSGCARTVFPSSTSEWEVVHRKLQQIKDRGDNPFTWVLADTKSVTLHSDWQQWGGGDF